MKTPYILTVALGGVLLLTPVFGQDAVTFVAPTTSTYSSTHETADGATLPEAPQGMPSTIAADRGPHYIPFKSYAVALRIGSGGIGGEVATPLMKKLYLRGGAQFFGFTTTVVTDGLNATGTLTLQNAFVGVDYLPFHNGFRISPGITVHNDNHVAATIAVPGGQTFTLGDQDYTSDPTDPITGSTHIFFGNKVAPRFTVGWGNMFPRNGGHWSFPVDLGFEYVSSPTVQLSLAGSGCDSQGCSSINSSDNQTNINQEIQNLTSDLSPLRFFPILSFGVSYRIGH